MYTIYFLGYLIETRIKGSKYSSRHLQKHWVRELLDIEIKMARLLWCQYSYEILTSQYQDGIEVNTALNSFSAARQLRKAILTKDIIN
jgi:hypothetical protein